MRPDAETSIEGLFVRGVEKIIEVYTPVRRVLQVRNFFHGLVNRRYAVHLLVTGQCIPFPD
jgi:hypothetical protein